MFLTALFWPAVGVTCFCCVVGVDFDNKVLRCNVDAGVLVTVKQNIYWYESILLNGYS